MLVLTCVRFKSGWSVFPLSISFDGIFGEGVWVHEVDNNSSDSCSSKDCIDAVANRLATIVDVAAILIAFSSLFSTIVCSDSVSATAICSDPVSATGANAHITAVCSDSVSAIGANARIAAGANAIVSSCGGSVGSDSTTISGTKVCIDCSVSVIASVPDDVAAITVSFASRLDIVGSDSRKFTFA